MSTATPRVQFYQKDLRQPVQRAAVENQLHYERHRPEETVLYKVVQENVEYARVIEMCKGTELEDKTWRMIQWRNIPNGASKWECFTTHPDFGRFDPQTEVRFAVAVLEGRPVFVGDTLWIKDGHGFTVEDDLHIDHRIMSWTPPTPKRTFTLNGVELPCPVGALNYPDDKTLIISLQNGRHHSRYTFSSALDTNDAFNALVNILTEARDKP